MIYLDNAATTLIKPPEVARSAARAIGSLASPGRGGHRAAMAAAETAFECRTLAAEIFGADSPESVIFCHNATHGLNMAIKNCIGAGETAVISGYEHNSVYRPLIAAGARTEIVRSPLFDTEAAVEAFDRALKKDVKLAVVNYVSNVFGFILPVKEIAGMCRDRGIPLVVDASQAAGVIEIDFEELGARFMAMPGHKGLYGPQGTGILLCSGEARESGNIKTLIEGGSSSNSRLDTMPAYLPDRLEAGTHNMPGIAGLKAGMEFVKKKGTARIFRHERMLLAHAVRRLGRNERLRLYAAEEGTQVQSGVLSFEVQGMDSEGAAERLARQGIAVRAGLHCSPLAHGTAGSYEHGTVRVSFSAFNTLSDINGLAYALENLE